MKAKYGSTKAAILTTCGAAQGRTLPEIAQEIGRTTKQALAVIHPMLESGEIIKAGIRPWQRYFTDAVAASEFEKAAPAIVAQHKAGKREEHCARQRDKNAAKREAKAPTKPKADSGRIDLAPRDSKLVITTGEDKERLHKSAKITWPEHVQVQQLPGFTRDERFIFKPPNPEWQGEISRDWMDRRLADI